MLQCIRWDRVSSNMATLAVLTTFIGFLIYVFAQMPAAIISSHQLAGQPHIENKESVFIYLQIFFYVSLLAMKIRALWDVTIVYRDLKRVGL